MWNCFNCLLPHFSLFLLFLFISACLCRPYIPTLWIFPLETKRGWVWADEPSIWFCPLGDSDNHSVVVCKCFSDRASDQHREKERERERVTSEGPRPAAAAAFIINHWCGPPAHTKHMKRMMMEGKRREGDKTSSSRMRGVGSTHSSWFPREAVCVSWQRDLTIAPSPVSELTLTTHGCRARGKRVPSSCVVFTLHCQPAVQTRWTGYGCYPPPTPNSPLFSPSPHPFLWSSKSWPPFSCPSCTPFTFLFRSPLSEEKEIGEKIHK